MTLQCAEALQSCGVPDLESDISYEGLYSARCTKSLWLMAHSAFYSMNCMSASWQASRHEKEVVLLA